MSENRPEDSGKPEPQVIDLEAEEIKAEESERATIADEDPASPSPQPMPPRVSPKKRSGAAAWIIAAVIAGMLGGGWIYRDFLSNYLPTADMTAMKARLDALEASGKTIGEQLLAVSQASDEAKAAVAAVDGTVKSTAAGLATLQSRIDAVDVRIAAAETALKAARADLDSLNGTIASIGTTNSTGGGTSDPAALASLNQRIATLEKDVANLKAASGTSDKSAAATALSQALADLKAKVAAGASFQAEYDGIARMVPAAAGLEILAVHAAQGLPSPTGLAKELRDGIASLPQPATPPPAGTGWTDWLLESLSSIVTIRDIGETDWPQLAEKTAALADAGDLTQAIATIDAAEGTKPTALSQWRDRATARLALEAAVSHVSEAVLRQIAAQGGVQ